MTFTALMNGKIINSLEIIPKEWGELLRLQKNSGYTLITHPIKDAKVVVTRRENKVTGKDTHYFRLDDVNGNEISDYSIYPKGTKRIHENNQVSMFYAAKSLEGVTEVRPEFYGITEDGKEYRIDMYVVRWGLKFALELQLTKQCASEYLQRSLNYIGNGIIPVWFYKDSNHRNLEGYISKYEVNPVKLSTINLDEHGVGSIESWKEAIDKVTHMIHYFREDIEEEINTKWEFSFDKALLEEKAMQNAKIGLEYEKKIRETKENNMKTMLVKAEKEGYINALAELERNFPVTINSSGTVLRIVLNSPTFKEISLVFNVSSKTVSCSLIFARRYANAYVMSPLHGSDYVLPITLEDVNSLLSSGYIAKEEIKDIRNTIKIWKEGNDNRFNKN